MAVDITELFAKAGFGGDAVALMGQPHAEVGDERGEWRAAFGRLTPYAGRDLVDLGNAAQAALMSSQVCVTFGFASQFSTHLGGR